MLYQLRDDHERCLARPHCYNDSEEESVMIGTCVVIRSIMVPPRLPP